MTATTTGIPTVFRGIEYRSRLEARWAALFTQLSWEFTYEPIDGNGYIPDFVVYGEQPVMVEVKPAVTLDEYRAPIAKAESGLEGRWDHDILIVGTRPYIPALGGWERGAGLLGERACDISEWAWDVGSWFRCRECGNHGIFHNTMSFTGRPCGHYDGDGHLGQPHADLLETMWAIANNAVKWEGRTA